MNWSLLAFSALFVVFCGCSGDEEDIRSAFEAYQTALAESDGRKAVDSVSSATHDLYQRHRDLAVSGEPDTIQQLSMIDRMQVLLIRLRVPSESLKAMNGKDAFAYAVENGWIGKDVVRIGIAEVAAVGNRATARVSKDGQRTRELFHFVKEGDGWKLDLIPTFKASDQLLQKGARSQGLSENEFIFSVISSLSGKRVTEEIWQPLE